MARTRPRSAALVQKRSIGVNIKGDIRGALQALEDGMKQEVLKSGAWAGATVIYDEMRRNAPVDQGELRDSIYRWRDDQGSRDGRIAYAVGPNKRKAPHWHLIEFGHWLVNKVFVGDDGALHGTKGRRLSPRWVPANPFIRRTFSGKIRAALNSAMQRMRERSREVMSEIQR